MISIGKRPELDLSSGDAVEHVGRSSNLICQNCCCFFSFFLKCHPTAVSCSSHCRCSCRCFEFISSGKWHAVTTRRHSWSPTWSWLRSSSPTTRSIRSPRCWRRSSTWHAELHLRTKQSRLSIRARNERRIGRWGWWFVTVERKCSVTSRQSQ